MAAGPLRDRFGFARRVEEPDGAGNFVGAWQEQFTVAAGVTWLRGGEVVIGQRLQGTQPLVLTIRDSADARQITADWRAEDKRAGHRYAVKTVTEAKQRGYLDILVMGGIADTEPGRGGP